MTGPEFLESYELDNDEDAEAELACGLLDDGTCMNAGTEWCDLSCPFSD